MRSCTGSRLTSGEVCDVGLNTWFILQFAFLRTSRHAFAFCFNCRNLWLIRCQAGKPRKQTQTLYISTDEKCKNTRIKSGTTTHELMSIGYQHYTVNRPLMYLRLETFQNVYAGSGSRTPELYYVCPDSFECYFCKRSLLVVESFDDSDAPRYVPNTVIPRDLQTATVKEEIRRYSSQYSPCLSAHTNDLTANLMELPDNRRLRRRLPNDLPTRFLVRLLYL
jgi:hypothetical protein